MVDCGRGPVKIGELGFSISPQNLEVVVSPGTFNDKRCGVSGGWGVKI